MPYYVALPNGSYVEMPDDISQDQAMRQISLDPRFRPIIEKSFEKDKSFVRDVGGYLTRGGGQLLTAGGSLIGVVPGLEDNIVGRGLRSAGEAVTQAGTGFLSPGTQRQQALFDLAMQEAEKQGLTEQAKTALAEAMRNPRMVAGMAIESLPALVGSFGAGLATKAAAGVATRIAGRQLTERAAIRAGVAGAVGSEALLEGGGSADEVYRSIMGLPEQELQRSPEYQDLLKQGLKPEEAKERLAVSAARQAAIQTAAISGTVGAVLPGAAGAMFGRGVQRTRAGRALGTARSELFQEGGQEGGGALSENIARQRAEVDRELTAGVGSRATLGAITGALVGAGAGSIRGGTNTDIDRSENVELRNILNEYVGVRGEEPVQAAPIKEQDASNAAFVAANLPVSEEQFLALPVAGRARVLDIAKSRLARAADSEAAMEQEQVFRQRAEARAQELSGQPGEVKIPESRLGERVTAPEMPAFEFPQDVKQALNDIRGGVKPPERKSLMQFLRTLKYEPQGLGPGISDVNYGNEIKNLLGNTKRLPGFINDKKGVPLDRARELAVEAGYLPEGADINALIDAIAKEDREGVKNYGNSVRPEAQLEYEERVRNAKQLEQALYDAGSDVDRPDNEIAAALGLEFPSAPRTLEDIEVESQARFAGAPPKELGPAEEYSRRRQGKAERKPRGPIGSTTPMNVEIPEAFRAEPKPTAKPAGQTEEQVKEQQAREREAKEQQDKERKAKETRRAEILQKLNDEYLAKLEAKGPQGKRAADAVRKNLQDRTLTAEQLYGAFKGAEIITNTLPANADHEIEFVKYLTDKSGQEVEGRRMGPRDSSMAGVITLSLSESKLPLLGETASHEAFHVLQDYYGKYDADFRKLMKQSFRDGMSIKDIDSTLRRKLQGIRVPNSEQSYWDVLVESLPEGEIKGPKGTSEGGAREAEAYVFGALAEAARRGVPMTGMKPAFTRFVNFLTKFFRRMKSAIRGDGFNSPEDVFGRIVEGDAARLAGEVAPEFRGAESSARIPATEEYSARLPPGGATYQAAALKINGDRMKQNSVLKRGIDALVGANAEYTYLYSGKKEPVKAKTSLAINTANHLHGFHLFDNLLTKMGRPDLADVGKALESAMNNEGRMETMIEAGGIGLNPQTKIVERNKSVKSLADIFFKRLKADEMDPAQRYLVAKHERALRDKGRKGFANLTDAEIDEVIRYSETNRPAWKEMAKDYDDWNKGLIKILVDAEVIDKKVGDELSSVFYTPLYRVIEDDLKNGADSIIGPKTAASLKNPTDALKKLSGEGTDPVGKLFENIIRNADGIVKSALKNVAMQKAVKSMEWAGLAEKVNTKLPGAKNIVTVRFGGKDAFYRVDDPILMTALATMPSSIQHGIYKALAGIGSITRDMITHTPAFTTASLIRGKEMSYVQDGVSLARSTLGAFGRTLKANFIESEKKKGDIPISRIRDITGFGGMSFGMGSVDAAAEFERMLRASSGQATILENTKKLLGWYAMKKIGSAAEMAERVKVYEHFKAQGKSDQDAAWEAYAMAPFSRRGAGNGILGATVNFLAPLVPFLNARIQGNFRLLEKGIHNPFGARLIDRKLGPDKIARGIWLRGMVLMAFSMAMAMLASDDEKWDDENPETKFMYHIAYLGSEPDAPKLLIPRGFELGTLFGAIPVFMYDAIRKDGGNDLGKLFGLTLQSTFGINPPASVAPVLEVVSNYNFFTGRELESAGMESRPKSERFTPETSEAAKVIANAVNSSLGNLPRGMKVELSPIQAQHLIKGYLGGVGVWSLNVVDTVLGASGAVPEKPDGFFGNPTSPAALAATVLQANRFVRGKEDMVSRTVGEFYDIKREVTQWTTAMNDAQIQNNIDKVKEIQAERGATLSMRKAVNDAGTAISQLSRTIDALRKSPELGDTEERRRRILELIRRRNQIAGRVVEIAREQGVR